MKNRLIISIWIFWLVVAFLFYRPFLLSPGFSTVDDGYSLTKGSLLLRYPSVEAWKSTLLETNIGRFRPVYLLYFSVIVALFGPDATGMWLGQTVVFWLILVALFTLLERFTHNRAIAGAATLGWMLMPAVWHNQLRLGTAEPRQLLFMLGAMLLATKESALSRKDWLGLACLTLLAIGTKETSIMLIPFLLFIFANRSSKKAVVFKTLVLVSLAAIVLFVTGYAIMHRYLPSGYAVQNFGSSFAEVLRRAGESRLNYARYYLPLWIGFVSMIARLIMSTWHKKHRDFFSDNHFSLALIILATESVVFVLLWQFQFERYFYLTWTFGAMLIAIELAKWYAVLRDDTQRALFSSDRIFALTCVVLTLLGYGYYFVLKKHGISLGLILRENSTTYRSTFDAIQISNRVIQELLNETNAEVLYTTSDNYEVIYELGLYASQLQNRPLTVIARSRELADIEQGYYYEASISAAYRKDVRPKVLVGTVNELPLIADLPKPGILEPHQRFATYGEDQYWWILREDAP